MPVLSPSLCIGTQPLVQLLPCSNHFPANGKLHGRYYQTIVSMQLGPLSQRKIHSLKAIGNGAVHPFVKKGFGFGTKSKRSVFSCNAALNAKCSQGQTQTVTRESPTITQAPTREKSPKLDDGGNGFPPRDGGGGGGGGGGGESFSGGFFLFGFLMFMGYLKDLEGDHENSQ
ncbi:unnamed protein product [Thlaspi arvense]|uniref:Uncharacterized protein n=1 Tax=Thlaspi arvense TaxID=13288 RepID=A0AAU9R6I5_THLAR|nr:unnamed protein product [Thlaspi arvense]